MGLETLNPLMSLVWNFTAAIARIAWWASIALLATALCLEGVARLLGQKPQSIAAGLSATVPDGYAGWQLRPNVTTGVDWAATNSRGLHDRRELQLKPDPGVFRVAVQGSSVTYGPGLYLKDTLPMQLENLLNQRGHSAEVLNFGVHGYNLLNVLGQSVAYTLQHEPHAVVLVLDLQVSYPVEPTMIHRKPVEPAGVKQLSVIDSWLKRWSESSVLLTWLDFPMGLRRPVDALGLRLNSVQGGKFESLGSPKANAGQSSTVTVADTKGLLKDETPLSQRPQVRSRRLRSLLAAVLAAYRESGIGIVVVPPFGPYYAEVDENLARFSLQMIANYSEEYGGLRQALVGELGRITNDIQQVGRRYGAVVLNLDSVNRQMTLGTSDLVSPDGIHPTPAGYRFLAGQIADSLSGLPRPARQASQDRLE